MTSVFPSAGESDDKKYMRGSGGMTHRVFPQAPSVCGFTSQGKSDSIVQRTRFDLGRFRMILRLQLNVLGSGKVQSFIHPLIFFLQY